jgi:dTDP-4-dehydrorhamnose reductase
MPIEASRPWREGLIEIQDEGSQLIVAAARAEPGMTVLDLCAGAAVVRVALLIGAVHGRQSSASEAVAWGLGQRKTLRLFTDQYRTPIDPESVGQAIAALLHRHATGTFHLGGPERISRYEMGLRTAALLGVRPTGIEAVRQADVTFDAPRALDASMDSSRARTLLGWEPRGVDDAIRSGRPTAD